MAYTDNKAPGRNAPTNVTPKVSLGGAQSNQERNTAQSPKTVSTASRFNIGNQVRVGGNTKGTGTLKEPTAIALSGKRRTMGAVKDPDANDPRNSQW